MTTSDKQIGENLAQMRGDMTQKDLASAMRERGWKWSQATVWSVEKGDRPLRLSEAQDVAAILNSDLWLLTIEEAAVRALRRTQNVERADAALREAIYEYDDARFHLAHELDQQADTELVRSMGQWIEMSVESVARAIHKAARSENPSTYSRAVTTVEMYRANAGDERRWMLKYLDVDYGGLDGERQAEA